MKGISLINTLYKALMSLGHEHLMSLNLGGVICDVKLFNIEIVL